MSRPDWLLPPVYDLREFPVAGIARQLGALRRYAGATPDHYSVARHSLVVSELVGPDPQLRLLALVHDAHECWTGDVLRPCVTPALRDLQNSYDQDLWALLGLDPCPADLTIVRIADDNACRFEMDFLGKTNSEIAGGVDCPGAVFHLSIQSNAQIDAVHWRTEVELMRGKVAR